MLYSLLSTLLLFAMFTLSIVFVWNAVPALTLIWVLVGLPTILYYFLHIV